MAPQKCETELVCWRELTWKRNDSNEWVKKEGLQRRALVLYPQHSHFNTHWAKGESYTPPILIGWNEYRPQWSTHSLWIQQGSHHICMQSASQFSHSPTHNHHDRVFSNIFINHSAVHAQARWSQRGRGKFQRNLNNYDVKNDRGSDFWLDWIWLLEGIQIQLMIYRVTRSSSRHEPLGGRIVRPLPIQCI